MLPIPPHTPYKPSKRALSVFTDLHKRDDLRACLNVSFGKVVSLSKIKTQKGLNIFEVHAL